MILLHARQLLRAVLSTGSQHFASRTARQFTYKEREVSAALMLPQGQCGPSTLLVNSPLSGVPFFLCFFKDFNVKTA